MFGEIYERRCHRLIVEFSFCHVDVVVILADSRSVIGAFLLRVGIFLRVGIPDFGICSEERGHLQQTGVFKRHISLRESSPNTHSHTRLSKSENNNYKLCLVHVLRNKHQNMK